MLINRVGAGISHHVLRPTFAKVPYTQVTRLGVAALRQNIPHASRTFFFKYVPKNKIGIHELHGDYIKTVEGPGIFFKKFREVIRVVEDMREIYKYIPSITAKPKNGPEIQISVSMKYRFENKSLLTKFKNIESELAPLTSTILKKLVSSFQYKKESNKNALSEYLEKNTKKILLDYGIAITAFKVERAQITKEALKVIEADIAQLNKDVKSQKALVPTTPSNTLVTQPQGLSESNANRRRAANQTNAVTPQSANTANSVTSCNSSCSDGISFPEMLLYFHIYQTLFPPHHPAPQQMQEIRTVYESVPHTDPWPISHERNDKQSVENPPSEDLNPSNDLNNVIAKEIEEEISQKHQNDEEGDAKNSVYTFQDEQTPATSSYGSRHSSDETSGGSYSNASPSYRHDSYSNNSYSNDSYNNGSSNSYSSGSSYSSESSYSSDSSSSDSSSD